MLAMTDVTSTLPANAGPHAHEPLAACPNCRFPLRLLGVAPEAVRFCPSCGQETTLHPPSVVEFAHEFVGHYVALEGPLWRTLWLLVRHPGQLTANYLAGKRRQYLPPLRLYLSASFILFLVLKLLAPVAEPASRAAPLARPAASAPARAGDTAAGVRPSGTPLRADDAGAPSPDTSRPTARADLASSAEHAKVTPRAAQDALVLHGLGIAPYVLFLMVPAFAGVVGIAYANRRRAFGEHLVFAMHGQTFAFLLASVLALATPTHDGGSALIAMPFYGFIALRRVYGGRWWPTLVRLLAILVVNTALLCGVTVVFVLWLLAH